MSWVWLCKSSGCNRVKRGCKLIVIMWCEDISACINPGASVCNDGGWISYFDDRIWLESAECWALGTGQWDCSWIQLSLEARGHPSGGPTSATSQYRAGELWSVILLIVWLHGSSVKIFLDCIKIFYSSSPEVCGQECHGFTQRTPPPEQKVPVLWLRQWIRRGYENTPRIVVKWFQWIISK